MEDLQKKASQKPKATQPTIEQLDSDDENCLDGRDFDFDDYINQAGTQKKETKPNLITATPAANPIKPAEPVPKKPKGKFEENEQ